ncbi:helix-turn-helix transcriptional regulator [Planobispora siamensis]|uniref:DNA-binding transcriptional regulator n=1 Tax=Planobispora siamensis TaxID=936338 RepID=A0A8J3SLL9_9ACTN|nr:WYL domain-containing protein [Planobispora siamensis]GIH94821.1 DNA-binding transcriptional regulator [Planobispora siamensis]
MPDTSARLLRLLSLLQTPRDWSGPQLAERLGVTTRTIRNDVERLRGLGYPVHATPGAAGGYRLGAGASLPPLLLDDEEAVAVAVGLRTAAGGSVSGIEETSLRALAKLEQVLPSRLRHRVNALHAHTIRLPGTGPTVEADLLAAIAAASRDRERLRFDYVDHDGAGSLREAEPHRLVHARGRWYLVAWDTGRDGWRTFRADRIRLRTPNGPRFVPREPPEGDYAVYVAKGLEKAVWKYVARVKVHAPAEEVAARLPSSIAVDPVGEHACVIAAGSDSPHMLALYLGMLEADFEVTGPPDLVEHLRELSGRYARAIAGAAGAAGDSATARASGASADARAGAGRA